MPPPGKFRPFWDRMHHPISHTAATVGAVALIILFGCGIRMLVDSRAMSVSPTWWKVMLLSLGICVASVMGYFAPHSRWALVPMGLSVVVGGWIIASVTLYALRSDQTGVAVLSAVGGGASLLFWTVNQWLTFLSAREEGRGFEVGGDWKRDD